MPYTGDVQTQIKGMFNV